MNRPVSQNVMDQGRLAIRQPEVGAVPEIDLDTLPALGLVDYYLKCRLPLSSRHAADEQSYNQRWEAHTTDIKDTLEHQKHTADKALAIASYFTELAPRQRSMLFCAAMYHDVGKFEMEPELIFKPARFTNEEYLKVQKHPQLSADITRCMKIKDFNILISDYNETHKDAPLALLPDDPEIVHGIADLVLHHHEHNDGKGYPNRMAGKDLSLLDSILTTADVFDALTSERTYRSDRRAYTPEEAINHMMTEGKNQFNPVTLLALHHMTYVGNGPAREPVRPHSSPARQPAYETYSLQ